MNAFQLNAAPQEGYVLTSNATGRGTWQPAPTVGGYWEPGEGWIYYDAGDVGIGTDEPDATLDVRGTGTDPVLRSISYDSGNNSGAAIYAELEAPDGYAIRGSASSPTGQNAGIYGDAYSVSGFGVRGHNGAVPGGAAGVYGTALGEQSNAVQAIHQATSGYGKAIFGRSDSPNGFGGYFMGNGYFSGNVGIGVISPTEKLDVAGEVKMTGFKLAAASQNGYVLTSDAAGQGSWQPPSDGYWESQYGTSIHYSAGNVGIGVANPQSALDVNGQVESNTIYTNSIDANTLKLRETPTVGHVLTCVDAAGNADWQPAAEGHWNTSTSGAIYYNGGNVGIGSAFPAMRLDVNGSIKATGLQLASSPQSGYVLTSDASGNGTWQAAAGGMALPYSGTTSSPSPAFKVTNSGTGMSAHAIYGKIEGTGGSGDAAAGYFEAPTHGHAIVARSSSGSAIDTRNDGGGSAIWASAVGATVGSFHGSGDFGHGIEAHTSGEYANGVYATASGGGAALVAETSGASTIGIIARGATRAAKFYGNVMLYD